MLIERRALICAIGATAMLRGAPLEAAVGGDEAAPLPIDLFAEKPTMQGLVLSPDGTRVLARVQIKGEEMLASYTLSTGEFQTFSLPKGSDLRWYRWAGNGRFLVSIATKALQRGTLNGFMDFSVEGYGTRLVAFDVQTQKATFIGLRSAAFVGDDVLFVDPEGEYLLLSLERSHFVPPSVHRFLLKDNEETMLIRPKAGIYQWFTDQEGVVRAGLGGRGDKWLFAYRRNLEEPFREVGTGKVDLYQQDSIGEMSFVSGSDEGYVLSNKEAGFNAVYKYDFGTRTIGEKIFASPTNDVQRLEFNKASHELEAIHYTDDRDRVVWMNPLLKEVQEGLDRVLPGRENRIVSRSDDNGVMIVHSGSARDPGTYYVFHLANTKLTRLVKRNEKLPPSRLSQMEAVNYRARDGLTIPAYLTLPVGRAARKLPLIILPHGGPYGVRDTLQFNPEVQFLASRGYAVLQPNYRGSDSYGLDYHNRGHGEWGRKMQDDLDDGLDWLVERGIVDPKRACMIGGSYGGYAAAWGATRNPERYRCAASFAGVFNLRTQLAHTKGFLSSRLYKQHKSMVRGAETFDLDAVSPLLQVKQLQVPVLLIHGDEDNVVPLSQSKSYAAALKRVNKAHEFHVIKDEGHGLRQTQNFAFYLGKLEAFLMKHNPA